jgi:hypothetical protein
MRLKLGKVKKQPQFPHLEISLLLLSTQNKAISLLFTGLSQFFGISIVQYGSKQRIKKV